VSKKANKSTARNTQRTQDYQAWRSEIESFCQQTIAHLQECIEAAAAGEQAEPLSPGTASSQARPADHTVASSLGTSAPAGGDLDTSQDRLANLKRELAAKLSKAKRDQK
jgi:hypothetical protein